MIAYVQSTARRSCTDERPTERLHTRSLAQASQQKGGVFVFVIVDRAKLVRMLDVTRDDKKRGARKPPDEPPYLRIAATSDGKLNLKGLEVEGTFPATVYEPGVLFIRARSFRDVLADMREERMLTIQASADELAYGNVHMPMAGADILLYPDPATAPEHHPGDRQRAAGANAAEVEAARQRVDAARQKVLLAAESMVIAETELAALLGEKFDPRRTLAKLLDRVAPRPRRQSRRK